MKMIIYQSYKDGFGTPLAAKKAKLGKKYSQKYNNLYRCQKALDTALQTIHIGPPDISQKSNLCQRELFAAESALRVQVAVQVSLGVESRRKKALCPQYKEETDRLKVAKFKVKAVKKACPDMGVATDGTKNVGARREIRKKITSAMTEMLNGQKKINKTDKQVSKIMASAHEAWKDVCDYGQCAPEPRSLSKP